MLAIILVVATLALVALTAVLAWPIVRSWLDSRHGPYCTYCGVSNRAYGRRFKAEGGRRCERSPTGGHHFAQHVEDVGANVSDSIG